MTASGHTLRTFVQWSLAFLLGPTYFFVLFCSLNAPRLALPIPRWAHKKYSIEDGPLGYEISSNLRLCSPHNWPHPIWCLLPIFAIVLPLNFFGGHKALIYFAIAELILVPLLLRFELHEYLADIGELPESGFRVPDPPGIVHGLRTCLYNLYLEFVVRADVLDFTSLACPQTQPGKFLPENFPTRRTSRPSVIRGLPQRQRNQCLPVDLEGVKEKMIFRWFPQQFSAVRAQPSENEGAGAMGLVSPFCKVLGSEFAHEHRIDGSWHVVLSPLDAHRVCTTGWGERGPPIVCRNLCQHFDFAPKGWVFLYAPQNESELTVLRTVIRASHDFVTQQNVTSK